MAREVPMPDWLTWNREVARKQARLDAIRQYKEQHGDGGITVDFRKAPRNVLEQTRREVRAIMEDPRFPNELVRHEEAMRVAREGQQKHNEVSRQAEEAYRQEKARLERLADAAQRPTQRSTNEILEREALLRRLERRWERNPNGITEMYKRAVDSGDQTTMELMEEEAGEFITNQGKRGEFRVLTREQKMARMSPQQRTAIEQVEQLVAEETGILGGINYQRHSMLRDLDNLRQGRKTVAEQQTDMRHHELRGNGGRDEQ